MVDAIEITLCRFGRAFLVASVIGTAGCSEVYFAPDKLGNPPALATTADLARFAAGYQPDTAYFQVRSHVTLAADFAEDCFKLDAVKVRSSSQKVIVAAAVRDDANIFGAIKPTFIPVLALEYSDKDKKTCKTTATDVSLNPWLPYQGDDIIVDYEFIQSTDTSLDVAKWVNLGAALSKMFTAGATEVGIDTAATGVAAIVSQMNTLYQQAHNTAVEGTKTYRIPLQASLPGDKALSNGLNQGFTLAINKLVAETFGATTSSPFINIEVQAAFSTSKLAPNRLNPPNFATMQGDDILNVVLPTRDTGKKQRGIMYYRDASAGATTTEQKFASAQTASQMAAACVDAKENMKDLALNKPDRLAHLWALMSKSRGYFNDRIETTHVESCIPEIQMAYARSTIGLRIKSEEELRPAPGSEIKCNKASNCLTDVLDKTVGKVNARELADRFASTVKADNYLAPPLVDFSGDTATPLSVAQGLLASPIPSYGCVFQINAEKARGFIRMTKDATPRQVTYGRVTTSVDGTHAISRVVLDTPGQSDINDIERVFAADATSGCRAPNGLYDELNRAFPRTAP